MESRLSSVTIVLIIMVSSHNAYAGAMAARRKQHATIQHQRIIQQKAIQQRMIQQKAIQQRMIQQKVAQRQVAQQQMIIQKQTAQIAGEVGYALSRQPIEVAVPGVIMAQPEPEVKEVAEFSQVWESLQNNSAVWPLIIDQEVKYYIISEYIKNFHSQGISIQKPPEHYIGLVDAMSQESPAMLDQPFDNVLRVLSIIEYDFDNGQDKDAMAQRVLGPEAFVENKKRLGLIQ